LKQYNINEENSISPKLKKKLSGTSSDSGFEEESEGEHSYLRMT